MYLSAVAVGILLAGCAVYQPVKVKEDSNVLVFISSEEKASPMYFDPDASLRNDSSIFNCWPGHSCVDLSANYLGKAAWKMTKEQGWGAVFAMADEGDSKTSALSVEEYQFLNISMAGVGAFDEIKLSIFDTNGCDHTLSIKNDWRWSRLRISLKDLSIDTSHLSHIAIYGSGQLLHHDDALYVTDLSFSKRA